MAAPDDLTPEQQLRRLPAENMNFRQTNRKLGILNPCWHRLKWRKFTWPRREFMPQRAYRHALRCPPLRLQLDALVWDFPGQTDLSLRRLQTSLHPRGQSPLLFGGG